MFKRLPTDVRQFRLRHLFGLVLSFALAGCFWCLQPAFGFYFFLFVVGIWVGMSLLLISDMLGQGPIDERSLTSQLFSTFGALIVVVSLFGAIGVTTIFGYVTIRNWL
jgi:hypothetical protein